MFKRPVKINPVLRQKADALSAGIAIVRRILKDNAFPEGFTTKQMYDLTQDCPAPPNFQGYIPSLCYNGALPIPRPDHPIRSITFLKKMILPALEGCGEIVTVCQDRSGAHPDPDLSNLRPIRRVQRVAIGREFIWKVIPPQHRKPQAPGIIRNEFGAEVGVGADISHLNPRRQRSRVKKVTEAVKELKGQMMFSKELEEVSNIKIKPKGK